MPLNSANAVAGNLLETLKFGAREPIFKASVVNTLDNIPNNAKTFCNIRESHVAIRFQSLAFEINGMGAWGAGESDFDQAAPRAYRASNTPDGKRHQHRFRCDLRNAITTSITMMGKSLDWFG